MADVCVAMKVLSFMGYQYHLFHRFLVLPSLKVSYPSLSIAGLQAANFLGKLHQSLKPTGE